MVADGKDVTIVATSETMARILSDQCRKMAEQKKGEKTLGKIHAVGPTSTLRGLPQETRVVFDHTVFERALGDSNLFRLLDESRMLGGAYPSINTHLSQALDEYHFAKSRLKKALEREEEMQNETYMGWASNGSD